MIRTIISDAMEELGVLAIGTEPSSEEADRGLRLLQQIVDSHYASALKLGDVAVSSDTDLLSEQRALMGHSAPLTITLPENPDNGARFAVVGAVGNLSTNPVTLDANGRLIDGAATKAITAGGEWIYIADAASWQIISPLTLDDTLLFGHDDYFTLMLALRMGPRFGAQLSQESAVALKQATNRFKARYHVPQIVAADDPVRYMSVQSQGRAF